MSVSYKILLFLLTLVCLSLPHQVLAIEISITDNGSGSSSQVSVAKNTTSEVAQINSSSINNEVNAQSVTGNNNITDSEQGALVQTGMSINEVYLETNTNSNTLSVGCCQSEIDSVGISANGQKSTNTALIETKVVRNITSINDALIVNNIHISSSTGGNTIKNTTGNVTLVTGDAKALITVSTFANSNMLFERAGSSNGKQITIAQNGADTISSTTYRSIYENSNSHINTLKLINDISANSDTGNNTIAGVGGFVSLSTGNSSLLIRVTNQVNTNRTIISDCCTLPNIEDPGDPCESDCGIPDPNGNYNSNPSNTSTSGGNSGGGIGGVSSVLGFSTGDVLPATGANMGMWATFFNVLMLLFGLYLRRTAGRSPAKN